MKSRRHLSGLTWSCSNTIVAYQKRWAWCSDPNFRYLVFPLQVALHQYFQSIREFFRMILGEVILNFWLILNINLSWGCNRTIMSLRHDFLRAFHIFLVLVWELFHKSFSEIGKGFATFWFAVNLMCGLRCCIFNNNSYDKVQADCFESRTILSFTTTLPVILHRVYHNKHYCPDLYLYVRICFTM